MKKMKEMKEKEGKKKLKLKLKLPSYPEFWMAGYFSFKVSEELYVELNHRFGTLYLMWGDNDKVFNYSEEWDLTRDNYYKVCEICEKIYDGEMEFSELLKFSELLSRRK